ncbi:MAG: hypothetical protein ACYCR5_04550 [Leptospirillum sp.]
MRRGLNLEECSALYSLFQHPGMRVLKQRVADSIADELMPGLRTGGKEAFDRMVGRMEGVEGVLALLDRLKDEAIAKTKES